MVDRQARFRGALLGMAVGDALGFPVHGRSREFARTQVETVTEGLVRHESGFHPLGQISDDAQTALSVGAAIVECGRVDARVVAEHLAPLWRDHIVVGSPPGTTRAMEDFIVGRTSVDNCGQPVGCITGDALPRAIPIGLWCVETPEAVSATARRCTAITHRDARVQAGAAGIAAAVAYVAGVEEVVLGVFIDRVAAAVGGFHGESADRIRDFPRLLSITEYRVFDEFSEYAARQSEGEPVAFGAGVPDDGLFQLLLSLYYFLKAPFDLAKALRSALSVGGEVTTLCALVGGLAGAFLGESALPNRLIEEVGASSQAVEIADGLAAALDASRGDASGDEMRDSEVDDASDGSAGSGAQVRVK